MQQQETMKLGVSHQLPEMLTPEHLNYLKQMGVECLEVRTRVEQSSYNDLMRIREKVETAGLKLFEIMLADRYNLREIACGLPGRDEQIESFKKFLKDWLDNGRKAREDFRANMDESFDRLKAFYE